VTSVIAKTVKQFLWICHDVVFEKVHSGLEHLQSSQRNHVSGFQWHGQCEDVIVQFCHLFLTEIVFSQTFAQGSQQSSNGAVIGVLFDIALELYKAILLNFPLLDRRY